MAREATNGRIQFEMSLHKIDEISSLVERGHFDGKKDLFNNALTLLKWALKHSEMGHSIAAVDLGNEKFYELEMPFLSRTTRHKL